MLNSQFELSKIERKKREFQYQTPQNQENIVLPLLKIESRKRNGNYQRDRERNFSFYTRFFSRERDSRQCLGFNSPKTIKDFDHDAGGDACLVMGGGGSLYTYVFLLRKASGSQG